MIEQQDMLMGWWQRSQCLLSSEAQVPCIQDMHIMEEVDGGSTKLAWSRQLQWYNQNGNNICSVVSPPVHTNCFLHAILLILECLRKLLDML
jgi:hypothetical protein